MSRIYGGGPSARDGGQAETNFINKSISNLMLCLRTVVYNQTGEAGGAERQAVVPWRNSKLTQLFQYHLHGKRPARTVMIVNAAPAADCWQETSHVIANAAFSQEVKASSLAQEAKETKLRTLAPPEYGADGRRIVSRASSGATSKSPWHARRASWESPTHTPCKIRAMLSKPSDFQS